MKRGTFNLAVAILAFFIGTAAETIYLIDSASPIQHLEEPQPTISPTHFPGLSVSTRYMGRLLYFPPGALSANEWHDQFTTDWYSKHLAAMDEHSLYMPGYIAEECYRFLWLRSFHHPIAVCLWRSGDAHFVHVKQLSGAGGYEPGKLVINRTRFLTKGEWDEFIRLLEEASYWKLPTEDSVIGNDGARWVLEGVRENRYHIVDRWGPKGGNYREACLYLLGIANLGIDVFGEDIY